MKTMKLNVNLKNVWKSCRWTVLALISILFVCGMCICLMVNSGIAQKLAEHSEIVYIANAVWFAVVAFCSCKIQYLNSKRETKAKTVASGKYSKKEG